MPMTRQNASLPHTGIATFCKAAHVHDWNNLSADVAILGIPYDGMASMHPGCRQAPRAIRDASARFGWLGKEDRKSTRLNSSHLKLSRMPSSA